MLMKLKGRGEKLWGEDLLYVNVSLHRMKDYFLRQMECSFYAICMDTHLHGAGNRDWDFLFVDSVAEQGDSSSCSLAGVAGRVGRWRCGRQGTAAIGAQKMTPAMYTAPHSKWSSGFWGWVFIKPVTYAGGLCTHIWVGSHDRVRIQKSHKGSKRYLSSNAGIA